MTKRVEENLEEYGERLGRMPDTGLVKEIRSYKFVPRPPIVDMVVLEFCMKHLALPKEQRQAAPRTVQILEPKKMSYEEE
jgi:hypothetical protein